jgi:GTP:adenosylcobinamide-phosphate guanylyltransferase
MTKNSHEGAGAPAPFAVVVLAGERKPGADPLSHAAGVSSKILVPVAGRAVIDHVIGALEATPELDSRWLAGPDRSIVDRHPPLRERIETGQWRWLAPMESPASTALTALHAIGPRPVLVTTADHAWLRPEILAHFLSAAVATGADVAIGFARLEAVRARFPKSRRTGWRFQDGGYCGCNLFAFMTPKSAAVARLWRSFEKDRKKPWRIVAGLGIGLLARYALGRLTLAEGLAELGRRADCSIAPVVLPYPEAAVDVDSVADWELVNRLWQTTGEQR